MFYFIFAFTGFCCGGLAVYVALDVRRRGVQRQQSENELIVRQYDQQLSDLRAREKQFSDEIQQKRSELTEQLQQRLDKLRSHETQLADEFKQKHSDLSQLLQQKLANLREHEKQLIEESLRKRAELLQQLQQSIENQKESENQFKISVGEFEDEKKRFEAQIISYNELRDENGIVKRDLRNTIIKLRKLELDRDLQQQSQDELKLKVEEIGSRYLKENVKWIGHSLNANNFAACKQRLLDVVERCRSIGYQISKKEEETYITDLKAEYEKVVRAAFEREEQMRIKAQIREEQRLEREIQREQARIDRERTVLQEALARALATAADEHSAEIESLRARLAEAEAKQRSISQAQLTKAGFVYVISNIGSFGENVFKIGMTRRLEPMDRVRELGDASVPFPFDVHMMISCKHAPSLENALHQRLVKHQVNKTNPRKEFFRADIETIVQIVKENHGEVHYVADAEALQYRQSLEMSDEDIQFVDRVYDELEDENEVDDDDVSQLVPGDKTAALTQNNL